MPEKEAIERAGRRTSEKEKPRVQRKRNQESGVDCGFLFCTNKGEKEMLAIRLYVTALVVGFLCLAAFRLGIDLLVATVVTCSALYLILDMNEELRELRGIEARVSTFESKLC